MNIGSSASEELYEQLRREQAERNKKSVAIGFAPVTKTYARYIAFILNKEFKYTQKEIAEALGTKSSLISDAIHTVEIELARTKTLGRHQLDDARALLAKLGYKRLGTDVRNICYKVGE